MNLLGPRTPWQIGLRGHNCPGHIGKIVLLSCFSHVSKILMSSDLKLCVLNEMRFSAFGKPGVVQIQPGIKQQDKLVKRKIFQLFLKI